MAQDVLDNFSLDEATISSIQAAIKAREISCVDLVKSYIDRIHTYDFKLNAISCINNNALDIAKNIDEKIARGDPLGRLFGIPVILKDNINTFDMPTTNGSAVFRSAIPNRDAYIAASIREADAIFLGKASMGEFAYNDYNTIDGVVTNPYSRLRSTSGSSSGCAAALTANLATVAVGTDTSSSIRGPAAYAGIVGLRPTTGLSRIEVALLREPLFDTAGPMARTVTDVANLFGAALGQDETDPMSAAIYRSHSLSSKTATAELDFTEFLKRDALKGARIGLVHDFLRGDPEVEKMTEGAVDLIRNLGACIIDIRLDHEYIQFNVINGSTNIRSTADFSFRSEFEEYLHEYFQNGVPKRVGEIVDIYRNDFTFSRKPVEHRVLSLLEKSLETSKNDPAYSHLVDEILPAATAYKRSVFDDNKVDALIYPTSAGFAPPIDTPVLKTSDPTYIPAGLSSYIFASYSSLGNPDITVPMGVGAGGLPAGISFMGRPFAEADILGFAYAYEQATNARVPPDLSWLLT